jgi:microcystin-dependent protein
MVSTYTPNLSLEIPAHGDYAATGWDTPMDNSLNTLDAAYGGQLVLACTGGTLSLTVAQAANPVLYLTGTLSSDQYISYPPIGGRRVIIQGLNLNGHTLYVRGNNFNDATGIYFFTSFGIPYPIIVTPSRVYWDYGGCPPGTIANMATTFIHNGWLPCDGRYVSQAQHDLLYDLIGGTWGVSGGSFRVPDYRGTVTAMADNIGLVPASGPYGQNEGSRGILNGWGVVTFAGEANHTLALAEIPYHNHPDAGHAHGVYDPGHAHGGVVVPGGTYSLGYAGWSTQAGGTAAAGTGIGIEVGAANIQPAGGSGAHNNIQPTTCVMKIIKW